MGYSNPTNILIGGLHFVALALGFAAVLLRGTRMREALDGAPIKNIYTADNLWGLAAIL